jgi:hypothetical protein
MTDKIIEYTWKENEDEKKIHLVIISGHVNTRGRYINADEIFTACGVSVPRGETLYELEIQPTTCESCLTNDHDPLESLFKDIHEHINTKVPVLK